MPPKAPRTRGMAQTGSLHTVHTAEQTVRQQLSMRPISPHFQLAWLAATPGQQGCPVPLPLSTTAASPLSWAASVPLLAKGVRTRSHLHY